MPILADKLRKKERQVSQGDDENSAWEGGGFICLLATSLTPQIHRHVPGLSQVHTMQQYTLPGTNTTACFHFGQHCGAQRDVHRTAALTVLIYLAHGRRRILSPSRTQNPNNQRGMSVGLSHKEACTRFLLDL